MTGWPCNRFVSARSEQALLSKVFALQRKGWICLEIDEKRCCAYMERASRVSFAPAEGRPVCRKCLEVFVDG